MSDKIQTTNKPLPEIAAFWGIVTASLLVVFFTLAYWVGVAGAPEVKLLNWLLMVPGLFLALWTYKKEHRDNFNYFRGFRLGIQTTLWAVIPFAIFVLGFTHWIDPSIATQLSQKAELTAGAAPWLDAILTLIVGTVLGIFFTYIEMQYFKKPFSKFRKEQKEILETGK